MYTVSGWLELGLGSEVDGIISTRGVLAGCTGIDGRVMIAGEFTLVDSGRLAPGDDWTVGVLVTTGSSGRSLGWSPDPTSATIDCVLPATSREGGFSQAISKTMDAIRSAIDVMKIEIATIMDIRLFIIMSPCFSVFLFSLEIIFTVVCNY